MAPVRTGASVSAKNGRLDEVEVVEQADPGDARTRSGSTARGTASLRYSPAPYGASLCVCVEQPRLQPGLCRVSTPCRTDAGHGAAERSAHQLRSRGVRAGEDGGGGRTRTSGTGLMRPLLYHLSYTADRKESTRCATGFYPNPGHCARDCAHARGRGLEIDLVDNVVPIEDASRSMPGHLHRGVLRDARADHVPDPALAKVVDHEVPTAGRRVVPAKVPGELVVEHAIEARGTGSPSAARPSLCHAHPSRSPVCPGSAARARLTGACTPAFRVDAAGVEPR